MTKKVSRVKSAREGDFVRVTTYRPAQPGRHAVTGTALLTLEQLQAVTIVAEVVQKLGLKSP